MVANRRATRFLLASFAAAAVQGAGAAMAWDPQTAWLSSSGYQEPGGRAPSVDRAFIREWEANPPKGYATLAPENLAATRAAIKRYSDLV